MLRISFQLLDHFILLYICIEICRIIFYLKGTLHASIKKSEKEEAPGTLADAEPQLEFLKMAPLLTQTSVITMIQSYCTKSTKNSSKL